jgi:hypothetical protein
MPSSSPLPARRIDQRQLLALDRPGASIGTSGVSIRLVVIGSSRVTS